METVLVNWVSFGRCSEPSPKSVVFSTSGDVKILSFFVHFLTHFWDRFWRPFLGSPDLGTDLQRIMVARCSGPLRRVSLSGESKVHFSTSGVVFVFFCVYTYLSFFAFYFFVTKEFFCFLVFFGPVFVHMFVCLSWSTFHVFGFVNFGVFVRKVSVLSLCDFRVFCTGFLTVGKVSFLCTFVFWV